MSKKCGRLFYNDSVERYDIRFDDGTEYGGLHCGDIFEGFAEGEWRYFRIEIDGSGKWYLVGVVKDKPWPEFVRI